MSVRPASQTPPLRHFSMICRPLRQRPYSYQRPWLGTLIMRRACLLILTLLSMGFAGVNMSVILSSGGITGLKVLIILIFTILFGWVAFNFWSILLGFFTLERPDPWMVREPVVGATHLEIPADVRIAVVMPVYNEDIIRIFAGVRVVYESIDKAGVLQNFDFFILSDSALERRPQEEAAWGMLCQAVKGQGRIFYRHRKLRIHKKSGNISDFCRRWGKYYKYMLPLDADSLISGDLAVHLARTMEDRPDIGILQTVPKAVNQDSLLARMQQFASHAYGPLFIAGSNYWQMDDAGFWGHNAIVRLEPFMRFCALPHGEGNPPFGGEILSHDFVEAALMRRCGLGVWLAQSFEGSYEELPPDLLTELERDRRWCRGNIQHLKLMWTPGLSWGHRWLFLNGNLFYISALFWLTLVFLMGFYTVTDLLHRPQYFPLHRTLFPDWPQQYPYVSGNLLLITAIFLFIPKFLSVLRVCMSPGELRSFGGAGCLLISLLLETIFSVLLAPIRMLFHSWYVMTTIFDRQAQWGKQSRRGSGTSMMEAWRAHGPATAAALVLAVVAWSVNRTFFWWLLIVLLPLIVAVPLSMLFSGSKAGRLFRQWGLFLNPAETSPPAELARLQELLRSA